MSTKLKTVFALVVLLSAIVAGYAAGSKRCLLESVKPDHAENILSFSSIEAAKTWFLEAYQNHRLFERKYDNFSVHSFYGLTGSGVQRVDAFFFGCSDNGCYLIGMKSGIESRELVEEASVSFDDGVLLIKSKDSFEFVFRLMK